MPITIGILASSGSSVQYWMARYQLGTSSTTFNASSVSVDSNKNIYTTHTLGYVMKTDKSGNILWQRVLSGPPQFYNSAVDSSGNFFAVGLYNTNGLIVKYDTNGNLQWQKNWQTTGNDTLRSIVVAPSGYIYVTGDSNINGGTYQPYTMKLNSDGTAVWQRRYNSSASETYSYGIAIDSSENVYITSQEGNGGVFVTKYDTNGNQTWTRKLDYQFVDTSYDIAVDSSGNAFITGLVGDVNGYFTAFLAKYDTSGTLQWQRRLTGSNADDLRAIALDSGGNVYVVGETNTPSYGTAGYLIVKYNTSGTIQWQRKLRLDGTTNGGFYGYGAVVDPDGTLYVTGRHSYPIGAANETAMTIKIPTNGSKTGTYTVGGANYVYESVSLTESAGNATASTPTFTSSTVSQAMNGTNLTSNTSSATGSVTNI